MSSNRKSRGPVEVEVDVTGLTTEGLGIASVNDRPLHIRNALPGERVKARIVKRRKGVRYADGYEILSGIHPKRAEPECAYFPRCGGCVLRHMRYEEQLEHKAGQIKAALAANGVEAESFRAPVGLDAGGYRRKARLGVRSVGGQVLVGFRESFSNRVARMDECQTLTPELSCLIKPLKNLISTLSAPDKIPQIEVAQGDPSTSDDTSASAGPVLVLRHLAPLTPADLSSLEAFSIAHQVTVLTQSGGYDTVIGLDGSSLPMLSYELQGLSIEFDPRQFTQVNAQMNQVLVARALEYLEPVPGRRVIDLFCGIGNFSLPLAAQGARVLGVELSPDAVRQAARNAQANRISGVEFQSVDLFKETDFLEALASADTLLLDPPRSGAGPHLGQWLMSLPELADVVYVSCNPKTFAEDARVFADHGLRLADAGAYDMFPQTAHVETIGHFARV